VLTDLFDTPALEPLRKDGKERLVSLIHEERWGNLEEIATAALFSASSDSRVPP
jgi:NAD(P)-dependent dehydrogenase (short-subunit alcohol dehydrogenase family)